jgi:hypothetical protein
MEGHAVKYRGRQVFFIRAGRHFCDVAWGQGVVRHETGYEGAHDAARVSSSAHSRFLVGGGGVAQDVVRPGDRQEPVCVLWRQLYVELDFDLVFGPDACFSGRLDGEISLLDRGFASVMAVLQRDLRGDR